MDDDHRFVVPGMRLCPADDHKFDVGDGVYLLQGFLYASLAGFVVLDKSENKPKVTVHVKAPNAPESLSVPAIGDIVT